MQQLQCGGQSATYFLMHPSRLLCVLHTDGVVISLVLGRALLASPTGTRPPSPPHRSAPNNMGKIPYRLVILTVAPCPHGVWLQYQNLKKQNKGTITMEFPPHRCQNKNGRMFQQKCRGQLKSNLPPDGPSISVSKMKRWQTCQEVVFAFFATLKSHLTIDRHKLPKELLSELLSPPKNSFHSLQKAPNYFYITKQWTLYCFVSNSYCNNLEQKECLPYHDHSD